MKIFLTVILFFSFGLFAQNEQETTYNKGEGLAYGFYLLENNNVKQAEKIFQEYTKSLKTINEKRDTYYEIALKYNDKLFYDFSISYALDGIKIDEKNNYLVKKLLQVVVINHIELGNYDLAEDYYYKSIKVGGEINSNDENLIGEIYRLKGNYKESISHFYKAIRENLSNLNDDDLAMNFNNIALSFLELGKLDSSEYYLSKSLEKIETVNLKNRADAINISFGKLFFKKKEYKKALFYFKKSIENDLSGHRDVYEIYRDAYDGIWQCQEKLGNFQKALVSYKKFQEYNNRIINHSQQARIFQNQIMMERIAHDKEVDILNNQIIAEQKHKKIMQVLFVGVFVLLILFSYVLWLRNKSIKQKVELQINKNKIQNLELDKIKLSRDQLELKLIQNEQDQKIKRLQRENLEKKLDFQNRELTATAIHLLNKNEILNDISEKISLMTTNASDELISSFKQINNLIKDSLHLDNDWNIFKKHFTEVHPNFFKTLVEKHPDLTTDELKLCAYLKIQMSSKEIARLINVSLSAVNKRRNRMRKKLNLSPKDDLYEFLLKLSDE